MKQLFSVFTKKNNTISLLNYFPSDHFNTIPPDMVSELSYKKNTFHFTTDSAYNYSSWLNFTGYPAHRVIQMRDSASAITFSLPLIWQISREYSCRVKAHLNNFLFEFLILWRKVRGL